MRFLIRVDSSARLGAGHFMRCLSLAKRLTRGGHLVEFIASEIMSSQADRLAELNFPLHTITSSTVIEAKSPEFIWHSSLQITDAENTKEVAYAIGADWLIVDHYGLSAPWSSSLRSTGAKICVIDDLCNRDHDCDVLVDSSPDRDPSEYEPRTPKHAEIATGSRYYPLRPEALPIPDLCKGGRDKATTDLLISLGGSDPKGLTIEIVRLIRQRLPHLLSKTIIVLGASSADHDAIASEIGQTGAQLLVDPPEFLEHMASSRLVICSASATAIEARYLGRSVIAIEVVENQSSISNFLRRDSASNVFRSDPETLTTMVDQIPEVLSTARACHGVGGDFSEIDGKGLDRVVKLLCSGSHSKKTELRPLQNSDLWMVLEWRNHPDIRKHMYRSTPIEPKEHIHWYEASKDDDAQSLLVYQRDGEPLGFVSFRQSHDKDSVHWGFYTAPAAPKGTGREMGRIAIEHAFRALAPNKIMGEVLLTNEVSAKYHRSLGFEEQAPSQKITEQGPVEIRNFALSREGYDHATTLS